MIIAPTAHSHPAHSPHILQSALAQQPCVRVVCVFRIYNTVESAKGKDLSQMGRRCVRRNVKLFVAVFKHWMFLGIELKKCSFAAQLLVLLEDNLKKL